MTTVTLANARLVDRSDELFDLTIVDGAIAEVSPYVATVPDSDHADDSVVHDLAGWLLVPSLAEPHAHLDKALTAELVPNPRGDLIGAIEAWHGAAAAGLITHDGMVERAIAAIDKLLVHGVTAVRTHVNVLESTGAAAVLALREAARAFEGLLDLQIVGLVGFPITGPNGAGTRAALAASLEAGLDLVGGCPHLDPDGLGLIDLALTAATEAGIGIDFHVDEVLDPGVLTLRDFAKSVIDTGFEHPVTASHCVSLGLQQPDVQAEVASLVAEANMSIVPLPQTNLFLQGREQPTATPRALTAVAALQEAGVNVAAGGDNVQDPFNLVGRSDPLETAALMVMAGHQLPDEAFAMVSANVRTALGLPAVSVEVGSPADLLAIDAPSVRGAIADAPMSRRVFRAGTLVASSDEISHVNRPT